MMFGFKKGICIDRFLLLDVFELEMFFPEVLVSRLFI